MPEQLPQLPEFDTQAVALWLSSIDREHLHNTGWHEANGRLNNLILMARGFINEHYPDAVMREGVYDGLTLGLIAMLHFTDIQTLAHQLGGLESSAPAHLTEPIIMLPPDTPQV